MELGEAEGDDGARVLVVGGTGFIGRAIVRALVDDAHEVTVLHRGVHEPDQELPSVEHVHVDRSALSSVWPESRDRAPDVLVDVAAYTRSDARQVIEAIPEGAGVRLIVLSSQDVYAAWGSFVSEGKGVDAALNESAPLRSARYLYRGRIPDADDYEKLDVEEEYLARGATVLRLPMVYGEHDEARREEFILGRCRQGRGRIPFGPGTLRWSRGYVGDIAYAVALVVNRPAPGPEVFNVSEGSTWTIRGWAERILSTSGCSAELVRVPDGSLPEDLRLSRACEGSLLFDSAKLRKVLGWAETPPAEALERSVRWHLSHPPTEAPDLLQDDRALAEGAG